jgi:flagellar M-ring protein FliF
VTVANALPGAQPVAEQYPQSSATNRRIEETTNYEMSRTVRSEVREQGVVKRLSVAVALAAGAAPRSPEDLARIDALVKSAIGFSAARGDRVDVVEVAFTPPTLPALAGGSTGEPLSSPQDALRIAEIAALSIIGLGIVVFVLRPLLASKGARLPQALGRPAHPTPAELPAPVAALEQKIDLARVDGQVRASSINKVAEVVRGHTDESVGILRNWIRQAS